MKRLIKNFKVAVIAVSAMAASALYAADVLFNFDTDPLLDPTFLFAGGHASLAWCSGQGTATNGNPSTGGYLSITDGNIFNPGQGLVAVLPDIDGGYPIKAFHLTCDVRAGNSGNGDGRPADGFSISYCRAGDPVLVNATNGIDGGAAGGDSAAATLDPNGSGDLENGTKSGVAIVFDAWQGNMLPDTGPGGTPGPDVEGIEIRVDDKTLRQLDMSGDRNGGCYSPTNLACGAAVCTDANTEQTGPWANDGGAATTDGTTLGLCWARLDVELTTNKLVTVIWKGRTLVDHFALTNYPNHRGRLVLMGRTGGNGQNAHFDNIHLVTTPAIEATFDRLTFGPNLNQFTFFISDNTPSIVTNVSQVILDGTNVTSQVTIVKNGTQNTGTYTQTPFFAPGTTHTVSVTWQTSLGQNLSAVNQTFTVTPYLVLSPTMAVAPSSVDLTKPGFLVQAYQTFEGTPNRDYYADEQLQGLHGTNAIDFTTVSNVTADGVVWDSPIDFANAGGAGQFPLNFPWTTFGIPGTGLFNEDNSSIAVSTYLYFPVAGLYYMGVNSDDGFRLSFAKNSKDLLGTELGVLRFDGGRGIGNNQNIGAIFISTPGYYGARLMFYNGGGGSGLEFYTTSTPVSGVTNILVNDTNNPGAVLCFRASSAAGPYVSHAEPPLDDDSVLLNRDLKYDLTDSGTTVNVGTIALSVNGVPRSPAVTNSGGVTHIVLPHPPTFWPKGTNTVNLSFLDSAGTNYNYSYMFVVQAYASSTLSTNLWTATGSGSVPGYRIRTFQSPNTNLFNGWNTSLVVGNAAMNGIYGADISDTSWFTNNGAFLNSGVINYAQNNTGALSTNGDFQAPTFPDSVFPALPGPGVLTMDNDAMTALSFVEFPAPGTYLLGVNSDDGFRVTYGDRTSPGKSIFGVIMPADVRGDYIGINTLLGLNGQGFGGPLPTTPLIGRCVVTDPLDAHTALNNAGAIAGNIALTQRGAANFAAQSLNCFNAGAIAVIGTLGPGDVGQLPSQRGGSAPTVTIPCVELSYEHGTNLIAHATTTTSSPLVVRVSEDCSQNLGEFNGGRGSSDSLFIMTVPQAGLYPLRLLWYNGGGDANCEFFWIDSAGNKFLLNDPSSSIKTWTSRTLPGPAHLNLPVVSAGNLVISWTGEGELEQAYDVTGPWTKSAYQANPATIPLNPLVPDTYYRIRQF